MAFTRRINTHLPELDGKAPNDVLTPGSLNASIVRVRVGFCILQE